MLVLWTVRVQVPLSPNRGCVWYLRRRWLLAACAASEPRKLAAQAASSQQGGSPLGGSRPQGACAPQLAACAARAQACRIPRLRTPSGGRAASSRLVQQGSMPERLKGADCKSAGNCLHWFESSSAHYYRFRERWQSGSMHQF